MTIPRRPLLPLIVPRNNRLPHGAGLWWPLHGSFVCMPDTPALTETVVAGSANASKWSADALMYALPADNGGATNSVGLLALHDDDAGASTLDQVLTLNGAAVGTQVLIACTAWWVNQQTTAGYFWAYGQNTVASLYGLSLTTGDKPSFLYRGPDAGAATTLADGSGLTLTGTALESFTRSADVHIVTSLHVTSSTTAEVEIRCGNGTSSAAYTGTLTSTTSLPGQNSRSAANHVGLGVGCKPVAGPTCDNFLGNGAAPANSARIGNVCARRFSSYDSGRALQAVTDLLARPDDYPDSWLE